MMQATSPTASIKRKRIAEEPATSSAKRSCAGLNPKPPQLLSVYRPVVSAPKRIPPRSRVTQYQRAYFSKPQDSHQDDVIVQSVETENNGSPTGIDDYLNKLAACRTYNIIRTDPDNVPTAAFDPERDITSSSKNLKNNIDYTRYPKISRRKKTDRIFSGTTYKSRICLAIVRIAEKNLPFINFISALNHLPNLKPTDPYPRVHSNSPFLDDIVETSPSNNDKSKARQMPGTITTPAGEPIKISFIPRYYLDGRHCIGYHVNNPSFQRPAMFFTPCTYDDLEEFGLRKLVVPGREGTKGEQIAVNSGTWYYESSQEPLRRAAWENTFLKLETWKKVMIHTMERDETGPGNTF